MNAIGLIGSIIIAAFMLELIICLRKTNKPKPKYKRYMIFVILKYTECGGLYDIKKSFDDVKSALTYCRKSNSNMMDVQLFDRIAGIEIDWKIPEPPKPEMKSFEDIENLTMEREK